MRRVAKQYRLFNPSNVSKVDAAYSAGIIDGEGCIRLQPKTFGLDISVGNTELDLLIWLRDRWGGKIYSNSRHTTNRYLNSKPFFHWRVNGPDGFVFLESILPYMVIKNKRAEKALELKEFYLKKNNYLPGFNEKCRAERQRIYLELKEMNRRGAIQ